MTKMGAGTETGTETGVETGAETETETETEAETETEMPVQEDVQINKTRKTPEQTVCTWHNVNYSGSWGPISESPVL